MSNQTRDLVRQLRAAEPNMPAIRIAKIAKVSKARIGKILKTEGLPTRIDFGRKKYCLQCNKEVKNQFCSDECKNQYRYVSVNCTNCNIPKLVTKKRYTKIIVNDSKVFCTHKCSHTWYWKHFPERMQNRRKRPEQVNLFRGVN